ncbi:hypothetical protein B0T10DRAFT_38655 [Thelonectria olida]|uniref:Uncharacterized protein n=1 Tax=Thelonectria olida TaxID=1576542 RepID=A0A9P9AQG0_9HYPO|nr:hypothetical protein B0T10DRAFT_38655 [Thelonectria olida]
MAFRPFPRLPPELQTQVWETCTAGSCMHLFDVCFPSRSPGGIERAFRRPLTGDDDKRNRLRRLEEYKDKVFLDRLDGGGVVDASMYRYANSLRQTHPLAAWATKAKADRFGSTVVCLPGRNAKVTIPSTDVLMLRFRDTNHTGGPVEEETHSSLIGQVLRCQWSAELASTLQTARSIALDVVEGCIFSPLDTLGWDEMTHLASTIHQDLEVLYLVDTCAGRCGDCYSGDLKAGDLQRRGTLWRRLDQDGKPGDEGRPGDVIRGVGRRYVEVFDLEALGWGECHQAYGFAFLMNNAIRLHQSHGEKSVFKGIRVLVVEDE